ncbi:MAG: hypothetical protein JRI22_13785 [Deltaproteobacteria bacterium]|nr:hypothetical protein [Deltaproteobacteria bacterium]
MKKRELHPRIIGLIVAVIGVLHFSVALHGGESEFDVDIYYNEACGGCRTYIDHELLPVLRKYGLSPSVLKDYVSDKQHRKALLERSKSMGIPPTLQGHIVTFAGKKIVLMGHVPIHVVRDILERQAGGQHFSKILVRQDIMDMEKARTYQVWAFKGEPVELPIDAPIAQFLQSSRAHASPGMTRGVGAGGESSASIRTLLPVVLSTGLLDGINPCAFAVLLFFIAFLFTIQKSRGNILKMGSVYIAAIFLIYFLIGLGLMKVVMFSQKPHFMARVGAILVIILGIIHLKEVLLPRLPLRLRIPQASHETLKGWMYRATLPASAVLGILVGLCTFPCSGGIYVAIVGLLASKATYAYGLGYLVVYNLMFISPLVVILALASNPVAARRLAQWERVSSTWARLLSGATMVGLGILILTVFV